MVEKNQSLPFHLAVTVDNVKNQHVTLGEYLLSLFLNENGQDSKSDLGHWKERVMIYKNHK